MNRVCRSRPSAAEPQQSIERVWIGDEVAPAEAPGILRGAEQPLEARPLRPSWRALLLGGQEPVETAAGFDPADAPQAFAVGDRPQFLPRLPERHPQHIGAAGDDVGADGGAVAVGEVAVVTADDLQIGIEARDRTAYRRVAFFGRAQHVEAETVRDGRLGGLEDE